MQLWNVSYLHGLSSIGLKKGDNVIIPSINFVAAANICKIMGKYFFADVDKKTYQLSKKC